MRKWFKNYVRAKMLINPEFAASAKNRLALLYLLGAWNIFGVIIALLYKEKVPKVHDSIDYAKVLGIKDATVVKYSGLSKVAEYDIHLSDEELDKFKNVIGTEEEMKQYEQQNEMRIKEVKEENKKEIINR